MDGETDILNPNRELKINGETVVVKELRWSEALAFLKNISAHVGKIFTIDAQGKVRTELNMEKLEDIITGSEELTAFLVEKSTGKTKEWFDGLSMSQALEVLDTAVDLNLSEQILKKVSALGRRFQVIAPGAAVSAQRTTT
jgi:ribosomal protein L28